MANDPDPVVSRAAEAAPPRKSRALRWLAGGLVALVAVLGGGYLLLDSQARSTTSCSAPSPPRTGT